MLGNEIKRILSIYANSFNTVNASKVIKVLPKPIFRVIKLVDVFEKHEIMQISHEEGFDPNIHEAIMQDSSDEHDDGEIIQVLQQGYRFRERVLRPSLVKINKK
jgi:molecular chaperone GrpE